MTSSLCVPCSHTTPFSKTMMRSLRRGGWEGGMRGRDEVAEKRWVGGREGGRHERGGGERGMMLG